jgi:adenosine deaminase
MALTRDDILAWPKAELHCHLDGSLRLATMLELAADQRKTALLPAETEEGLKKVLRQIDDAATLEEYLAWFGYTIPLMQSREALHRIAYELAMDAAEENVRYIEVRFGPVLHTAEGLSLDEVTNAVLAGLRQAHEETGIITGLIVCGLRDRYESASLAQAELAGRFRGRGVVAFDLAGGEAGNPPKQHLSAFYEARDRLLGITVHAGESYGPASIRQALFHCGAHRIGHGVTLRQDPDLLDFVVDHQIPLEMCPTSNVQTHVVTSYETHPIAEYVEAGVAVTVNTDNRLFSHTTVTDELWLTHSRCGVSEADLRQIAYNGFVHSFLAWDQKRQLLSDVRPQLLGDAPARLELGLADG